MKTRPKRSQNELPGLRYPLRQFRHTSQWSSPVPLRRLRQDLHRTARETPWRNDRPDGKGVLAIRMLLEGASVRSVERTTEIHRDTILRLLVVAGEKCEKHHGAAMFGISRSRTWNAMKFGVSLARRKSASVPKTIRTLATATRSLRSSARKLVLNIAMGKRDQLTTNASSKVFGMPSRRVDSRSRPMDLRRTDLDPGHFGDHVDLRDAHQGLPCRAGRRAPVLPAEVQSVEVVPVCGIPIRNASAHRSLTQQSEYENGLPRFTRLTNAFSKKWENHWAAVALWYTYYNFCRIHNPFALPPRWPAGSQITSGLSRNFCVID